MEQSTATEALRETLGGEWTLLTSSDNHVLTDGERVAKVPRHADGGARLLNGLRAAAAAAAAGVPVVAPLHTTPIQTRVGPVTVWPYVDGRRPTAGDLTIREGEELGYALGLLAKRLPGGSGRWEPFERAPDRLTRSRQPADVVVRTAALVESVRERHPAGGLEVGPYAHGDISVGNTVHPDGKVLLIDLDSAGNKPKGWDLACLRLHLEIEGGNRLANEAALAGWATATGEERPPAAGQEMELVKATMVTTFLHTLPAAPDVVQATRARLQQLEEWVSGGRVPTGLVRP